MEPDARDVLDELAGHLDDTIEGLRAEGLTALDAERRATARLGDPTRLGRELSRTEWNRRRLLAAAGGGVKGFVLEGLRAWFVYLLAGLLAYIPLMLVVLVVAPLFGREWTGSPTGPVVSLVGLLPLYLGAAWVGHVLPVWVAKASAATVRSIRRPVAAVGLVVGSLVLWLVIGSQLDIVTAVGLPFVPVVFAISAVRAPERPAFRLRYKAAAVLAAIFLPVIGLLLLVSSAPADAGNWTADVAPIGVQPEAVGLEDGLATAHGDFRDPFTYAGMTTYWVYLEPSPPPAAVRSAIASMQVEFWPMTIEQGVMVFGQKPLVVARIRSDEAQAEMPQLKDPVTTVRFLVGLTPDGTRVILDTDLSPVATPPWKGTLADWWFGG